MFYNDHSMKNTKIFKNFIRFSVFFLFLEYACFGVNGVMDFPEQGWLEVSGTPECGDYAVGVVGSDSAVFVANNRQSSYTNFFMEYMDPGFWMLEPTPSPMNPYKFRNAVAMAWEPDTDAIYALLGCAYGSDLHWFFKYDIHQETWYPLPTTDCVAPNGQGAGDAMTYVPREAFNEIGSGYLYCFIGNNEDPCVFARYIIGENEWEPLDMPSC
jgi:hypothetical protein